MKGAINMEEISKIFNKINSMIAVIITSLNSTFGTEWILFAGYLVLNILDYLTGIAKAKFTKTESSANGLKGIIKKVGYWFLILVSFIITYLLVEMGNKININIEFINLFAWFTLACLIINEARSILENLVELGLKVPIFLTKGLEIYQKIFEKKVNEIVENKEEK